MSKVLKAIKSLKAQRPIPESMKAHCEDTIELTGSWIGAGADGTGCETIARFSLHRDRLIVCREKMIDAIEGAHEDGFKAGYEKALADINATLGAIS